MPTANLPQILLAAGDYDIVYPVQQALQNEAVSLQRTFTHRDTLYALEHGQFDLIIVDAAMIDRHSKESTLMQIVRQKRSLPLIAINLRSSATNQVDLFTEAVITRLDKQVIVHAVNSALSKVSQDDANKAEVAKKIADEVFTRQIDEIQTLFALSRSLTEVLELSEVLNRVVEAARRLTNAEEGMILLPGDEDGELFLRARVGIDVEVARNFRIKTQDTLAGQVFHEGQPLIVGDQGPQKVKTEYFVNSLLYVPILLKGTPIGVLGVNNKTKQDVFDDNQQELLMNLASYAAIAIENARIHEESLQRSRELETLVEVSQILNASLSLEEILPNICHQLARVLNVNRCDIFAFIREAQCLAVMARYHRALWRFGQGPTIPLSKQPTLQKALKNNQNYWVSRLNQLASAEDEYLEKIGAGALLVVPIFSQERVLGALRAFYVRAAAAPPSADLVQSGVHMALEGLALMLSQPDQTRSQNIVRVLENVNRLIDADWCDLSSLVNDGQALSIHAEVGSGLWLRPPTPVLDVAQHSAVIDGLQDQALVFPQAANSKPSSETKMWLDAVNSRAILGLPLVQRGQTYGVVLVGDTERSRVFSQREIDMARTIVGQASTALENANLLRDLELSLQELKDTQDRLVQTARLSAMGELAAVVAHQINNPLTTIVVDTELMMLKETPESPNYQTMQAILRAGKRAAGVAKRLLAVSRPNEPDSPTELIEVVDTINGVLSLVQTHIERDNIKIVANLPENPLPRVQAVRGQLDDVWLNLLMNAHDALFGQANAQINIDITYNHSKQRIEVRVWDNGPGIPNHIKRDIFNPFFTTKPVGEGTGLGLHICRQVIERVGGEIWVESEEGKGAHFFIHIPIVTINT